MTATMFNRNKLLNASFGGVTYSPPSNYYLLLSTSSISTTGSNASEPVGAGYARVQIPNTKSYFTLAASGSLVNNALISFAQSSGSWGSIVDIGLADALTSGSIWWYTALSSPRVVQDLSTISFSASAITFSIT